MMKSWLDDHWLQLIPTSLPQLAMQITPCVLRLWIGTAAHARRACSTTTKKVADLWSAPMATFFPAESDYTPSTHVHQSLDVLRNLLVLVGCWPESLQAPSRPRDRSQFEFFLLLLILPLIATCSASPCV